MFNVRYYVPFQIMFIKGVGVNDCENGWHHGETKTIRWISVGITFVSIHLVTSSRETVYVFAENVRNYDNFIATLPTSIPSDSYQVG